MRAANHSVHRTEAIRLRRHNSSALGGWLAPLMVSVSNEAINGLGKYFGVAMLLAWIGYTSPSLAADAVVPTFTISRQDVVQHTVKRFEVKGGTNEWMFMWELTERGAARLRAFKEAHYGQTTRMRIGEYQTKPRLVQTNWLRQQGIAVNPTNKMAQVLRVNAEEARKILAELEKK